jgi:hypothetical protein
VIKIEIKDFQSIEREVIEIDGFSALSGRSNIGKSAIIRAIKAALTGAPADGYVRHNLECPRVTKGAKSCKCFCSVHIIGDDLDLLWEKGDLINRYVHNGTEYTVVGRGTPDFLMQGFAPIKLGEEKDILQISDQFKPIFILDKPGTVAADVLSDVAKLDEINIAMRLVERDRKDAKATRKVREKDILDLQQSLMSYEGLDEAVGLVPALESADQQVEVIKNKLVQLDQYIEYIFSLGSQIKLLKDVNLIEIPVVDSVVDKGLEFVNLEKLGVEINSKETVISKLNDLDTTTALPDAASLFSLVPVYEKLIQWALKFNIIQVFLDKVKDFDLLFLPSWDDWQSIRDNYFCFDQWSIRLDEASKLFLRIKEELEEILQEEKSISKEYESLGLCPYCNRPLNVQEHFHGGYSETVLQAEEGRRA